MRTLLACLALSISAALLACGGDDKPAASPTPIGSTTATIKVGGQTMTEANFVAQEKARIDRNGKQLVCGPGLDVLKGIQPKTKDDERAIELVTKLCAATK